MNKNELRKYLIAKRETLSSQTIKSNSQKIASVLLSLPIIKTSQTIFVYKSFRGEVDTNEIISTLRKMGKTLVFPYTEQDKMFAAKPLSDNKKLDEFGIEIPTDFTIETSVDVAITPLVGCDLKRNRMGFGKGFYDKFFSLHPCYKIGVCHDFQVVDSVFPQEWDVPLDCIITENRIF